MSGRLKEITYIEEPVLAAERESWCHFLCVFPGTLNAKRRPPQLPEIMLMSLI